MAAATTVRSYVKRLRQTLGRVAGARILTRSPGYLIRVAPDELDLLLFLECHRLAEQDVREQEWQRCADRLDRALALWRGSPLADVPSGRLQQEEVAWLVRTHTQVLEWRMTAALRLGRHEWASTQLERLILTHPLHERFHEQLMTALDRLGRRADALAGYQRARRLLVDELGIEPGPGLRAAHRRILNAGSDQATGWDRDAPVVPAVHARTGPPRQLPAPLPHFVGREAELARLDGLLAEAEAGGQPSPVIAVSGAPGVGKTSLALHWGHRVADRFPDGQLYLDLRGFHPTGVPASPAEAIRDLLSGFVRDVTAPPAGLGAQVALYRSILADRRVLIVLDNASDSAHVRSLLPGGTGCVTVVTSRSMLSGLVAAEGARPVVLDLLSEADARKLLARRLGTGRVEGEPTATGQLIELCQRLPLALSMVAARGATCPTMSLASLAEEMSQGGSTLDALQTDAPSYDVRATFSWSYRQLAEPAARMFRLLGLCPGTEISPAVAASLAGVPGDEARVTLVELARVHLLAEGAGGRFRCHDLLRAYAGERMLHEDATGRAAALHRMLDHYLHTASRAALLLDPIRLPLDLGEPRAGVLPTPLRDTAQALAWFTAERTALLRAVRIAAEAGHHTHAWQIAWSMADFLHGHGYHHDLLDVQRLALVAARRADDPDGEARIRRELSRANQLFDVPEADCPHLLRALLLHERDGDLQGQARTHLGMAYLCERQGRHRDALAHAERTMALSRAVGDEAGQAAALNMIGWCHTGLGDLDRALEHCLRSLDLHRRLRLGPGEAYSLDSLGRIHGALGDTTAASTCYLAATQRWAAIGNRVRYAVTLRRWSELLRASGDVRSGRNAARTAQVILHGMRQVGVNLT